MASLRYYIDDIIATVNLNSDDTVVDRRSIKFWIENKRSSLVKQSLEKRILHSELYKQSIPCFELELADKLLSNCCINLSSGCQILKSVNAVPSLITFKGTYMLTARPLNVVQNKFNIVSHDTFIVSGNSRFDSKDIYITLIDDYLYVKSNDKSLQSLLGKYLYLEGIFETPSDLTELNTCQNRPCFSEDEVYPIERWMYDIIKQEILTKDLRINLSSPEDTTNDATSSIPNQQK